MHFPPHHLAQASDGLLIVAAVALVALIGALREVPNAAADLLQAVRNHVRGRKV